MLNDHSIIMAKNDNKEHILRKTFYLMLLKGYDGVSISDIQQETGLSRGLLYHHFGSKEELFRVAGERFLVDLFAVDFTNQQELGFVEMIEHVVKHYWTIYESWKGYPGANKITMANYDFLVYQMLAKEKSIAAKYAKMRSWELAVWKDVAERALQRGEIRPILSSSQVAFHCITLLDGIWLQALEDRNAAKHIRQITKTLLGYYQLLKL